MTVRRDKIRRNVHTLSHQIMSKERSMPVIEVSGIGSLEILAVRPFLQQAFRDQSWISVDPSLKKKVTTGSGTEGGARREDVDVDVEDAEPRAGSRIRRFR